MISTFRELGTNVERRETLIGLASSQMLVQLSSMPIAMTIPSVARDFDVEVSKAAWMVIIRLLMLGSTVFLTLVPALSKEVTPIDTKFRPSAGESMWDYNMGWHFVFSPGRTGLF